MQIFFWYFAVLRTLPGARDSLSPGEAVFLNVRGLYLPRPMFESGFGLIPLTLGIAIVASIALVIWNRRCRDGTGNRVPAGWLSLALIIGLPLMVLVATGVPVTWDMPALAGFNFQGGLTVIPEFLAL